MELVVAYEANVIDGRTNNAEAEYVVGNAMATALTMSALVGMALLDPVALALVTFLVLPLSLIQVPGGGTSGSVKYWAWSWKSWRLASRRWLRSDMTASIVVCSLAMVYQY